LLPSAARVVFRADVLATLWPGNDEGVKAEANSDARSKNVAVLRTRIVVIDYLLLHYVSKASSTFFDVS